MRDAQTVPTLSTPGKENINVIVLLGDYTCQNEKPNFKCKYLLPKLITAHPNELRVKVQMKNLTSNASTSCA